MPCATLWGSSSHGHMNSDLCVAAYASAATGARSLPAPDGNARRDALERAAQRPRAKGLHGVNAGRLRQRVEGDRLPDPLNARAGQGPATHLDHEPMHGRLPRHVLSEFVAEREPALHREPVLVALAGEGQGAFGNRPAEAVVRGVAAARPAHAGRP